MQVQQLERLPALQAGATLEFDRLLRGFRLRLGLEQLALFVARGVIASSLALTALAAAVWLDASDFAWFWLAGAPIVGATVFALVRWPTRREAAMLVDRRLGLDERLATAVELAEGEQRSRFGALQLQDALAQSRRAHLRWRYPHGRARSEALLGLAALAAATAAVVLLPHFPRTAATPLPSEAMVADLAAPTDQATQRALPLEVPEQALPTPIPARAASPSADLAARVQQEQAERSALDKLSHALSTISAGQPATDAIQQGDFSAAQEQLQNLADNADQLTGAAKQQLAQGLQQAAGSTAQADRALADREQQAAQALSRSSYSEQRQALRALADQVQRSAAHSAPSDQLQRDIGQLQQQNGAGARSGDAPAAQNASGVGPGAANQPGAGQSGGAQSGAGAQDVGTLASGQNGNDAGDQNSAGVGTGTDPNLFLDQPSRLDTAGQQVRVPLKLGSGAGVRPADGNEDQSTTDPGLGARTTSELSQTQQTGQVVPEQNLVPGEQRPVVRGYFR